MQVKQRVDGDATRRGGGSRFVPALAYVIDPVLNNTRDCDCKQAHQHYLLKNNTMAASLSSSVSSLQSSLQLLDSSIHTLDSGVNDFPRLCKVLQTTRVSLRIVVYAPSEQS